MQRCFESRDVSPGAQDAIWRSESLGHAQGSTFQGTGMAMPEEDEEPSPFTHR